MSDELFQFLLSLSILFPFFACIILRKEIPKSYYPLVYVIVLGFVNEIINYFFFLQSNAIPMNVFNLVEYVLYCIQFWNWKHIFRRKISFYLITGSVTAFWVTDELILQKITTFSSFFLVIYPFILVLLAVNELNYLVANEHTNIIKNSIFLFCIGVIIFYSYRILSEVFYRYAYNAVLQNEIFNIQVYVNVLFNILLTLVVICIPKKRTIIQR